MTRLRMALPVALVALAGFGAAASALGRRRAHRDPRLRHRRQGAEYRRTVHVRVEPERHHAGHGGGAARRRCRCRDRIFYWLDDDDDLGKYRGQKVEIQGELEDIEKGKVEIDRKDDYTKVKLHLDGKTEEAKVPSSWLNEWANPKDQKFEIVARRIDVKKVNVLGACGS